jgi:uncharacterized integral membrane protein
MLWLMLLVWLGAMALLELLLVKAYQHIVGLLPAQSSSLPLLVQCAMMAVMGAVLAVFLLAAFRCIGLLGRRDREFLQPPDSDLARLLAE